MFEKEKGGTSHKSGFSGYILTGITTSEGEKELDGQIFPFVKVMYAVKRTSSYYIIRSFVPSTLLG